MPVRSARRSTASTKPRCSIFITKSITLPPSPQPKQWNVPCVGRTLNDGDFSSWNGHRPFSEPAPARRSATYSPTTSSIRARSRTWAMSASLIRPATARVYAGAPTTPPRPVGPPAAAASTGRSAAQHQAERVAGGIEVDPERGARLELVLAPADREHTALALVQVGHVEVQVQLLRVLVARPTRRAVPRRALEGDRRRPAVRAQLHPVLGLLVRVQRP